MRLIRRKRLSEDRNTTNVNPSQTLNSEINDRDRIQYPTVNRTFSIADRRSPQTNIGDRGWGGWCCLPFRVARSTPAGKRPDCPACSRIAERCSPLVASECCVSERKARIPASFALPPAWTPFWILEVLFALVVCARCVATPASLFCLRTVYELYLHFN